jgi:hypothetical protein
MRSSAKPTSISSCLILVTDKGPGRELHGGRTPAGVAARVPQRILALTAAIWHNWHTTQLVLRSTTNPWNRSSR